jgi:hypothetical protein
MYECARILEQSLDTAPLGAKWRKTLLASALTSSPNIAAAAGILLETLRPEDRRIPRLQNMHSCTVSLIIVSALPGLGVVSAQPQSSPALPGSMEASEITALKVVDGFVQVFEAKTDESGLVTTLPSVRCCSIDPPSGSY